MEYVRQAIIFLLVAKFFQVFVDKKENQKYIKGFAGLLTITILLSPIKNICVNDLGKMLDETIHNMEQKNYNYAEELLEQYGNMEASEQELESQDFRIQIKNKMDKVRISMQKVSIPKIEISK